MRVPPSGRVPEQGHERFLVATEVCAGGTPDLFSVLEVLGYVELYRRKKHVRGATRAPRDRGRAPHPRGPLVAPLTDFFRLYIFLYLKTIGEQNRSGFRRCKPL